MQLLLLMQLVDWDAAGRTHAVLYGSPMPTWKRQY